MTRRPLTEDLAPAALAPRRWIRRDRNLGHGLSAKRVEPVLKNVSIVDRCGVRGFARPTSGCK